MVISFFKKHQLESIFALSIIFYILCWQFNFHIGMTVSGLPLIFFMPGKLLIESWPKLGFNFSKIGRFSLSALYSFSLSSVLALQVQKIAGFNSDKQIWALLILNLFCFVLYFVFSSLRKAKEDKHEEANCKDLIILSVFAIAIIVTIIMNPMAQNYDNYLIALKMSLKENVNLLGMRHQFISYLALVSKFLYLNIGFVYRNVYNFLFFLTSLVYYDYLKRNIGSFKVKFILGLALLMPSVILVQVNYTMPQIALVVMSLPVLVILVEAIKNRNLIASAVSLTLSLVALSFHQLSGVLVVVSTIALIINLLDVILFKKKIYYKYLLLFLVIIAGLTWQFHLLDFFRGPLIVFRWGLDHFQGVNWRWWFINNYKDIDGVTVGFVGLNALYYYLYNGILNIFVLIFLGLWLTFRKIKLPFYIICPFLYFLFFFVVAEISPRVGLIFLPSRAWLHMMIPVVIMLALLVEIFEIKKIKINFIMVILIGLLISGYGATIYLTKYNIKKVYRGALPVASYIKKNIPQDSVIISSQDNNVIVNFYANHYFYGQILADNVMTREKLEQLISEELEILEKNKDEVVQEKLNRYLNEPEFNSKSVYFLYVYSQLDALNNAGADRQGFNDKTNRDVYPKLGYEIVFSDKDALLLKVR